jgi:hypothetical protein
MILGASFVAVPLSCSLLAGLGGRNRLREFRAGRSKPVSLLHRALARAGTVGDGAGPVDARGSVFGFASGLFLGTA